MNNLSKWIANMRTAGRGYVSFLNNKLKKHMKYDPSLLTNNELKSPMSRDGAGAEVAALNSLLSMMNDPNLTGAKVPEGEDTAAKLPVKGEALDRHGSTLIGRDPVMEAGPQPGKRWTATEVRASIAAGPALPNLSRKLVGNKIFLTGRIKMGKDYVAAASEAVIFNLADPLYALAEYCFGVTVNANAGKEEFGVRDFLQTVGQWGRGEVNAKYPLTPGRAVFIKFARGLVNDDRMRDAGVDWSSYGVNQNIWLAACVAKVNRYLTDNPGKRVIISGVRFVNEFKFLRAEGANHYHVMASPATWLKRLAAAKVSENSPALKDMSEGLAASLDNDVTRKISQSRNGPKLHVIWNDTDVASPSQRLLTLNEFLRELAIADVPLVEGAEISED